MRKTETRSLMGLMITLAILVMAAVVPANAAQAKPETSARTAGITIKGHSAVHAEIVPLQGGASPNYAHGCDLTVCMTIYGDGLSATPWEIEGPIANGDCTYSAYWVPTDNPALFGPDLCNTTGAPAIYRSQIDMEFSGSGQVCSTVLHTAGKPCEYVSP